MINTGYYAEHKKDVERIKKWIGLNAKTKFSQQEYIQMLDSGNVEPIYKAFSAYAIKQINGLTFQSPYLQYFFSDTYQEAMYYLSLAIQNYDKTKNNNFAGYAMSYVKGSISRFLKMHTTGVVKVKTLCKKQKENDDEKGMVYASVLNFSDLGIREEDDRNDEEEYFGNKLFILKEEEFEDKNEEFYNYILDQNLFSPTEKEVFKLYYHPQYPNSIKETAEKLGITSKSMNYKLYIIKEKIKKHLNL